MKKLVFAAALMLGTAAMAQDAAQEEMTTDTATSSVAMQSSTVSPGNMAPERDARGIPVVSAPASAPPGANQGVPAAPGQQAVPAPNQAQVFATQPATGSYPPCTREVTDGCVQTYERGVRAPTG